MTVSVSYHCAKLAYLYRHPHPAPTPFLKSFLFSSKGRRGRGREGKACARAFPHFPERALTAPPQVWRMMRPPLGNVFYVFYNVYTVRLLCCPPVPLHPLGKKIGDCLCLSTVSSLFIFMPAFLLPWYEKSALKVTG